MPSYKKLLVASAKGGVGKSTTALGLAVQFAGSGTQNGRVLLIDLDMTSRSLDILAGVSDKAVFGFGDFMNGSPLDKCVVHSIGGINGLDLMAACSEKDIEPDDTKKTAEKIKEKLEEALSCGEYDVVICDTGGGVGLASEIAPLFDMILVTSEQSQTSIRAAEYAAMRLDSSGGKNIRLVVCAFDLPAVKRENRAGIIEMIDRSSLRCAGVVPYDKKLQKLQDDGKIPQSGDVYTAYKNIARRIEGYDVPLFYGMKKLRKKLSSAL